MAITFRIKRGPQSTLKTLKEGEFGLTTDQRKLYIGTSAGNEEIEKASSLTEHNTNDSAHQDIRKKFTSSSVEVGLDASAASRNAVAIGHGAKAPETNGIAIGVSVEAGSDAVAMGRGTKAPGLQGVAIGTEATAYARAVAIGLSATSEERGVALGYAADALKDYGIAIGHYANVTAENGIAIGVDANAKAEDSVAFGRNATVSASDNGVCQIGNYRYMSALRSPVELTVISDERDKADIKPINKALQFIKKIKPIQYVNNHRDNYLPPEEERTAEQEELIRKYGMCHCYDDKAHAAGKKKGERQRVGVGAQQVQEALRAIYGTADYANLVNDNLHDVQQREEIPDGVESQLTVNYTGFVPFLIQAVQELSARVEELEKQSKESGCIGMRPEVESA